MAAPKLIQLLSTFTKEDWFSIKKAVLNHVTESSDTYRVFKFIFDRKTELSGFENINLIVAKHFKEMSSKTFLNHLSVLTQYTQAWLVQEQVLSEPYTAQLLLHRSLQKRGLYHHADQLSNQMRKELRVKKDMDSIRANMELNHQSYYSYNPAKYALGHDCLTQLVASVFEYQYHTLAIYRVELVNWGKIQNHDFGDQELKTIQVMNIIQRDTYNDYFIKMYLLIKNDQIDLIHELKSRLINNEWPSQCTEEVISTIYLIRKASELYERGIGENTNVIIAELFEFAMKQGVYVEHGRLSPVTFRNIVGQLGRFQSFESINAFIANWYTQISTPFQDTTKDVCFALNCLNHQKYQEIFLLTRMKHFSDDTEKALALSLHLIACFVERKHDYDLYSTSLSNFISYMNRNKALFSAKFFNGIMNTINIMKKADKKEAINLSTYETIFYRKWCERLIKNGL